MGPLIRRLLALLTSSSTMKALPPAPVRKQLSAAPSPRQLTTGKVDAGEAAGTVPAAASRLTQPGDAGTPMAHIPPEAQQATWVATPDIQYGVKYSWVDAQSRQHRFRAHSAQSGKPPEWNSSRGPIYREEVDGQYVTPDGRLFHKNVHNPNSPFYDAQGANDTHTPWPDDVPLPWKEKS